MRNCLLIFLFLSLFLKAKSDTLFPDEEDLTLCHHVNVISGNLNLCFQDAIVEGAAPLSINRTYSSAGALERLDGNDFQLKAAYGNWYLQGGWSLLPHMHLLSEPANDIEKRKFYLSEKNGTVIKYVFDRYEGDRWDKGWIVIFKPEIAAGQCSGILSARTHPKNNRLYYFPYKEKAILYLPDGGSRQYEGSFDNEHLSTISLKSEISPTQHHTTYDRNEYNNQLMISAKNPTKTKTFSSAELKIVGTPTNKHCLHLHVSTSDGKELHYRSVIFQNRHYLNNVESNCRPYEDVHFIPGRAGLGARMEYLVLGGSLQFKVQYYMPPDKKKAEKWKWNPDKKDFSCDKVKIIEGPMGKNGESVPIAHYSYSPTHTDVRDVENILTRYFHDGHKLLEIHYFDQSDQLNSLLRFTWEGSLLKGKAFFKNPTEALFSKTFQYDGAGNVLEEVVWGNFTGNNLESFTMESNGSLKGAESYRKRFMYLPKFNVPTVEEEEEGPTYRYYYKPDTNLITAQFICDKEKILVRQFFFYNEDNLLVQEITDDGRSENPFDLGEVTERHIKRYTLDSASGLITSCTQSYVDVRSGQENTLKRTDYTYSLQKRVITESIYDANGTFRYTIYTDYDSQGRVILKTTPLGQCNTYRYDALGKLLESKEVGSPQKKYSYHPCGNPISCEEIGPNGESCTLFTTYDAKGRLLVQTDPKGNTTTQTYDPFGRCLSTQFPLVKNQDEQCYNPTIHFTYDAQGNLATTTSPRNETTQTVYNSLKKPIRVQYPDGSTVRHIYNKNGTLAKTIYPDEAEVHYTYDLFQRMTSKKSFSNEGELLAEEFWELNAFHLISHTDEKGLKTTFEYDGAGRKIAEYSENRAQYFSYDLLGFLERTTDGNLTQIEIHDDAGRVIDKCTEDAEGRLENRIQFFYDDENRKIKATRLTSQGVATDYFVYDSKGHLCRHENPLGNITQFIFTDEHRNDLGQRVAQKITVDPIGNQKIETFDALDRLRSIEKRDPFGSSVSFEELFHDALGNCAKKVSTVYEKTTPIKKIATVWEYDCHGHVLKEIESGQKTTTFTYDLRGNLSTKQLPSGITLHYSYDGISRMMQLLSSDRSVHYDYFYDRGPAPISIIDQVQHLQWERNYDRFGQILEERGPFGINYHWDYDSLGRCTRFTLPDHSSITYDHHGAHLCAVQRRSSQNKVLYEHHYKEFDPNGHVQEEELILGLGKIKTAHDLLERSSIQISPYMNHNATYGPSGLVIAVQNSLVGNKNYLYDALDQLIQETNQHYLLNSLGNPTNAIVNDCNQILATADCNLAYDPGGNPITRTLSQDTLQYSYDALGRLLSIKGKENEITYQYDPFSRLLSKKVKTEQEEKKHLYLYDKEIEIGLISPERAIQELKVLGLGIKGDIGAAIALELVGTLFAPLHDFGGNIVAIISTSGRVAESYHTNAYGKETIDGIPSNPWRFCSKRNEEGLVYFGKRFYDPSLGRWLTPDPAGFTEGPNLYLYVLNNPLNRLDLFGLASDLVFPWRYENDARINVSIHEIANSVNARDLIVCKGSIGDVEVDWVVSCGHWHKLQYSPEELNAGVVNIVDHFHEIMPKDGMIIGLITAQNGMQNSFKDFKSMSKSIIDKVPESALYLGLHNPPSWLGGDGFRVMKELNGKETPTVARTRQFMEAIVGQLHDINPKLLWMHISHSEGGLIAHTAINKMNPDKKTLLKEHLISLSLGSAHPIARTFVFAAENIYSNKDFITKWFAKPFIKDPEYDIKFVKCTSSRSEMNFWFADHPFAGTTYQKASNDQIDKFRTAFGYYNDQSR